MIRVRSTSRLKQLALGGALAALVAVGAGGVAPGPAAAAQQALNFTKLEHSHVAHSKASPKLLLRDGQAGVTAKANVQDFSLAQDQHHPETQLLSWSWGASNS